MGKDMKWNRRLVHVKGKGTTRPYAVRGMVRNPLNLFKLKISNRVNQSTMKVIGRISPDSWCVIV